LLSWEPNVLELGEREREREREREERWLSFLKEK